MTETPPLATSAEIAPLRLPDPAALFATRARRFEALARDHALGDYLLLLARVARGQARAVREIPVRRDSVPRGGPLPLAPARVERSGAWRRMLALVLAEARAPGLPWETIVALRRLEDSGVTQLEALAGAVLSRHVSAAVAPDALATAPFVGAALQAYFAALAAGLDAPRVERAETGCPVCGSPPVAGVVRGDDRLRYLACALCGSEWYLPRVHCASCRGNQGIVHFTVDEDEGAKAEACEPCRGYVKLFDLEKRPGAEPLADDAATLALDLLMSEEGYGRAGVNLLLAATEETAQA